MKLAWEVLAAGINARAAKPFEIKRLGGRYGAMRFGVALLGFGIFLV